MPSEKIQHIFIAGADQVINQACVEFRDTDIINASFCHNVIFFSGSYQDGMVGILSFLQVIALEGSDNTYKGTKYTVF